MGVSHAIQLVWGLPWEELVRPDGSHLQDDVPPVHETAPAAMSQAIDAIIRRPWRAKAGSGFADRWTIGVFGAGDSYGPEQTAYVLGIELSSCDDKDHQLWGRGVEEAELVARRRCAADHLLALGIERAPRLLVLTGSA